jgi:hypothetical protein
VFTKPAQTQKIPPVSSKKICQTNYKNQQFYGKKIITCVIATSVDHKAFGKIFKYSI